MDEKFLAKTNCELALSQWLGPNRAWMNDGIQYVIVIGIGRFLLRSIHFAVFHYVNKLLRYVVNYNVSYTLL